MREYIDFWMSIIKKLENSGIFECDDKEDIKRKLKEMRKNADKSNK